MQVAHGTHEELLVITCDPDAPHIDALLRAYPYAIVLDARELSHDAALHIIDARITCVLDEWHVSRAATSVWFALSIWAERDEHAEHLLMRLAEAHARTQGKEDTR